MRCRVVSVTLGDKQNAQTTKKVLLADSSISQFYLKYTVTFQFGRNAETSIP